jgi:hypothetical protein
MSQRLRDLQEQLGGSSRGGEFPFFWLCVIAGVIAGVFLVIVLLDAYRQWRLRAPARLALKRLRQQTREEPSVRPQVPARRPVFRESFSGKPSELAAGSAAPVEKTTTDPHGTA